MNPKRIERLQIESPLFSSIIHGIGHWRVVKRNGHHLSQFNDADNEVISYFAYLHDCMRENEGEDPEHGLRGAQFAQRHRDLILLRAWIVLGIFVMWFQR
ncbi:MAG: hypothetical protein QF752_03745 [Planctomycetota bacterium]|jgi:uncharacterized protein|nr:hypothetical protein [Planctomycetota bacterium]